MADESPFPEMNPALRQMIGFRREMREMLDRQARIIEQQSRIALRVDEAMDQMRAEMAYLRRDLTAIRGDFMLMENRVLTAISEVRDIASRLDEELFVEPSLSEDDTPAPAPASPAGRHG